METEFDQEDENDGEEETEIEIRRSVRERKTAATFVPYRGRGRSTGTSDRSDEEEGNRSSNSAGGGGESAKKRGGKKRKLDHQNEELGDLNRGIEESPRRGRPPRSKAEPAPETEEPPDDADGENQSDPTEPWKKRGRRPSDTKDKTVECMVCGKVFARGTVDLQRHQSAPSLAHLQAARRTLACTEPCTRCGLFFSSEEHLASHQEFSTCNPLVSRPALDVNEQTTGQDALLPHHSPGPATDPSPGVSTGCNRSITGRVIRPPRAVATVALSLSEEAGTGVVKKEERVRRSRMLVPDDRKAFFSLASLLIDPALIPAGTKLGADNLMGFIPPEKMVVLDSLKDSLLFEC